MAAKRQLVRSPFRTEPRVHSVSNIFLNYEGHSEEVDARPPDLSAHGMFINTSRSFPEGAVLNLRFLLALSGAEIKTRCEVRYCLEGVGVGVEFVGITPEAAQQIEREIQLCEKQSPERKGEGKKRGTTRKYPARSVA